MFPQDRAGLLRGGAGVQQREIRANAPVGTQRHEESAVVTAQNRHVVPLANTGAEKGLGKLAHLLV